MWWHLSNTIQFCLKVVKTFFLITYTEQIFLNNKYWNLITYPKRSALNLKSFSHLSTFNDGGIIYNK